MYTHSSPFPHSSNVAYPKDAGSFALAFSAMGHAKRSQMKPMHIPYASQGRQHPLMHLGDELHPTSAAMHSFCDQASSLHAHTFINVSRSPKCSYECLWQAAISGELTYQAIESLKIEIFVNQNPASGGP